MIRVGLQLSVDLLKPYKSTVFDLGPAARLPEVYRKFWREWKETTPQPVHYIPEERTWIKNEQGEMKRLENVPLPGFIPKELHEVITGGEMVIRGFRKPRGYARRVPQFWMPSARKSVVYSEVLDKHISVLITERAIDLIMEHQGLDTYLLKTKACDLGSNISLKLKRRILLALRDEELPYDAEKNKAILKKYEPYMLPPEEIEWYGLTLNQAIIKLEELEEEKIIRKVAPLKYLYRSNLVNKLKEIKQREEDQKNSDKSPVD